MRYRAKRTYKMTPAIAYSIGLIASDGCLQKDGRHIDLTSVDKEQLDNFSLALGRPLTITDKHSGQEMPAYRIQFSDAAYYDFLLSIGLTPAKSKTISTLAIPDIVYADFLRGLFDGDGSCYGYLDPRWRSSFMFYTSFASASLPFIEYLRATNTRLISVSSGSIRTSARVYSLVYAKADSRRLYNFMYYATGLLCLARKRDKLFGFTEYRSPDIISEQARVVKLVNTLL